MNVFKICSMALALITTLCEPVRASDAPVLIEVFADSTFPPVNRRHQTTVYRLDRLKQLQQELSHQLPGNPEKAKRLVLQRFQGMTSELSHQLENTAQGLMRAHQYGLTRYPAIVFDRQAVVYGVTDMATATQLYAQWLEQQP